MQHNDSVIYQETGQLPRTFFYPGNGRDSATIAYCEQERVGSRLFQIAIGAKHDAGWLCRWADGLVERREWGIGMTHGIAMGYDHFPDPGVLWTFLDYVAARQDSLWIATFHDVAAYVKERDAARLTVSRHKKTIEVNIQTGLAPHLFRQPLTLILRGMRVRQVMQDGRPLPIYQHQGQTLVDAAPQGGKLLIKLRR